MTDWQKFAPGGEHYETLKRQYGQAAADYVARVAESRNYDQLLAALSDVRRGNVGHQYGSANTWSLFLEQLYNDPFAAPIEHAESVARGAASALLRSPTLITLLVIIVIAWFLTSGAGRRLIGAT